MGVSPRCGFSFKLWTGIECGLDIIFSCLIGAFTVYTWIKVGKPTGFTYTRKPSDSNTFSNEALERCVIVWCLTIILAVCIWRIFSAIALIACVKRNSVSLGQYWTIYKSLCCMISAFVAIAAANSSAIWLIGVASCLADILTSYYIFILFPQLEEMAKAILPDSDKKKGKKDRDHETMENA